MRGLRPVFDEDVLSMTQDELRNVLAAKNVLVPTMKTLRTIVSDQLRDQPGSPVDPLLPSVNKCTSWKLQKRLDARYFKHDGSVHALHT